MTFTITDVLAWTLVYLNYFIVAKILILNNTFSLRECVYIILASLISAHFAVIGIDILYVGGAVGGIASLLLGMIYFYKIKYYSLVKTVSLGLTAAFLVTASDVLVLLIVNTFFPYFLDTIPSFPIPIGLSFYDFVYYIPYILLIFTFSTSSTLLLTKVTKSQRKLINENDTAQVVLAGISLIIIIMMILVASIWRNLGSPIEFLTWTILPLYGVAIATLGGVIFYAKSLHEQMSLRQKKAEQEILREYTEQIEQQQRVVSKMQHDIGNILSSMEGYLVDDDIAGLKEYFYAKVKPATADITDNNLALARLANIKIPEVKAILAAKLTLAQSAAIDTTFEASDIIDNIAVDSVALVRMLGIIMDNAIEELISLGKGKLMMACYVIGGGVTFVVQNTCRPGIQNLHELEQVGFSTKGEKRGLGLNNLAELADTYSDNINLHTSIEDGNFTQKLRVVS